MAAPARQDWVSDLTATEAWALLEERTQQHLHVGAREFVERWLAGVYGQPDDNPDALEIAALLPGVGVNPWHDDKLTPPT